MPLENRLERRSLLELQTTRVACVCAGQHDSLLRLLTLLAMCGVDPTAPPVLGPMAG
ncbi:MAG TPA: hypothetical protein VK912_07415 [Longimicrobiales bacterium]|nr:hypothetical protein [Longimicrobiales bacterium]